MNVLFYLYVSVQTVLSACVFFPSLYLPGGKKKNKNETEFSPKGWMKTPFS